MERGAGLTHPCIEGIPEVDQGHGSFSKEPPALWDGGTLEVAVGTRRFLAPWGGLVQTGPHQDGGPAGGRGKGRLINRCAITF